MGLLFQETKLDVEAFIKTEFYIIFIKKKNASFLLLAYKFLSHLTLWEGKYKSIMVFTL